MRPFAVALSLLLGAAQDRAAVPDAAAIKDAEKQVRATFKVVFMRIAGTGLDPADKYESPWLEDKSAGDGSYVAGVYGRCASDIAAFGILTFGR